MEQGQGGWKLETCHQHSQHLRAEMSDLFSCGKYPGPKSILSLGAVFLLFTGLRTTIITPCFNIVLISKVLHMFYFQFNGSSDTCSWVVWSRHNYHRFMLRIGERRKVT